MTNLARTRVAARRLSGFCTQHLIIVRLDADELAESLTPAGETRTNGSDRHIENSRNLLVAHALQTDEQDGGLLLFGKLCDRALEIAQFKPLSLLGWSSQQRFIIAQADGGALSDRSSNIIHVLIMQYREQPSTQISAFLPQMQFAEGAGQTILDKIVGSGHISR